MKNNIIYFLFGFMLSFYARSMEEKTPSKTFVLESIKKYNFNFPKYYHNGEKLSINKDLTYESTCETSYALPNAGGESISIIDVTRVTFKSHVQHGLNNIFIIDSPENQFYPPKDQEEKSIIKTIPEYFYQVLGYELASQEITFLQKGMPLLEFKRMFPSLSMYTVKLHKNNSALDFLHSFSNGTEYFVIKVDDNNYVGIADENNIKIGSKEEWNKLLHDADQRKNTDIFRNSLSNILYDKNLVYYADLKNALYSALNAHKEPELLECIWEEIKYMNDGVYQTHIKPYLDRYRIIKK